MGIWANKVTASTTWDRCFPAQNPVTINFDLKGLLGPGKYEVQVIVSQEEVRGFGAQEILFWIEEAAFFTVSPRGEHYHFGGICDLQASAFVTAS